MNAGGVVTIGECMLELSGGDGGTWRMGYAGDTFNTLWAIRALSPGARTTDYVSAFGDDPFSTQQIDFFKEHGIGTAASPVIAGARPGLYAITLKGAERSFTYWRSDSAARKLAHEPALLEKSLHNRKLIYFSGITLAILEDDARATLLKALATARKNGSTVAFDPNYRPRLWQSAEQARKATNEALAISDIALPTFPDEAELFGDATPKDTVTRLHEAGVGEVVVKDGAEPALVAANGREAEVAAVRVDRPVDTTGAGDSFNGAYLAARLNDAEPAQAARKAHGVAAAVVQVRGALAPFGVLRAAFGLSETVS